MTSLFSYIRHRYDKIKGDTSHSHPKESEIRTKLKKELYEYNQVSVRLFSVTAAVVGIMGIMNCCVGYFHCSPVWLLDYVCSRCGL